MPGADGHRDIVAYRYVYLEKDNIHTICIYPHADMHGYCCLAVVTNLYKVAVLVTTKKASPIDSGAPAKE